METLVDYRETDNLTMEVRNLKTNIEQVFLPGSLPGFLFFSALALTHMVMGIELTTIILHFFVTVYFE